MGGIWGSREFFNDALTEIAGYKAGVILSEAELYDLMRDQGEIAEVLSPDGLGGGRVHSSAFEEAVVYLLYRLGNTSSPRNVPISIELFHKYKNTPKFEVRQGLMDAYLKFMDAELGKPGDNRVIDPTPFMMEMFDRFGSDGSDMALELIEGIQRDMHRSAWGARAAAQGSSRIGAGMDDAGIGTVPCWTGTKSEHSSGTDHSAEQM